MNIPLIREFRLSPSGYGHGVACDANGAFIGSVPLLKRTHSYGRQIWAPRDCDEISAELSEQYGLPIDISSKSAGLNAIARALNAGAIAHAQLVALHLEFPHPPALAKSASPTRDLIKFIRELWLSGLLKAWNPNQPRWPAGAPDRQGGRFAPKGEGEPGIGHNQGPPLESELELAEGGLLGTLGEAAALAVPILLATTEPLNVGEDEEVEKINFHHAWPKYLGGSWDQDLVEMPESLHIQYHRKLDKVARRGKGKAYYDSLSPSKRSGLLRELATMTKEFDAEHGTHLYESMLKNGFPENP